MTKAVTGLLAVAAFLFLMDAGVQLHDIYQWHKSAVVLDFPAFYLAGDMARHGENPYNRDAIHDACRRNGIEDHAVRATVYPPSAHVLLMPLSFLSLKTAQMVWLWLKVVILLSAMGMTFLGEVSWKSTDWKVRSSILSALVMITVAFQPLWVELMQGQMNVLILACLTITAFFAKRFPCLSGTVCGLGISIKVLPGLILLWFFLRKRWKSLGAAIAFPTLALLAAPLVVRRDVLSEFVRHVLQSIFSIGTIPVVGLSQSSQFNRSLWASIIRTGDVFPFAKAHAFIIFLALGAIFTGLAVIVLLRHKAPMPHEVAFFCCLLPLLSPIAWHNFLVVLLLPLWILTTQLILAPRRNIVLLPMLLILFLFLAPVECLPEHYLSPLLPALLTLLAMGLLIITGNPMPSDKV
jgi:hypothetical protein